MPCPFTGPKIFYDGPNFLSQPKNLTAFKAELPQVGTLFGTQFPSAGYLIVKKLDFEKTKTTYTVV